MSIDEPGVERILPGQRLAREAVVLTGQTKEGWETSRHVRRAGERGEDSGGVEAGEARQSVGQQGGSSSSSSASSLVESFQLLELVEI